MKNIFPFLFFALSWAILLTNCKNKPTGETDKPVADSTAMTTDPAKLEGFWVNTAYWQALQSTKSPSKVADKAGIGSVAIQQDSAGVWKAQVSFNWHEGMEYIVNPQAGGKFDLMNAYEPAKKEFTLEPQPDGSVKMDTLTFTRLNDSKINYRGISSQLVGGTYSLKSGGEVKLNPDGTASGLNDYTHYEVLLDYVTEAPTFDQIMLSKGEDKIPDFYGYQMKDGKLTIFSLDCKVPKQDPCLEFKMGKVKYELTKTGN